MLSPFGEDPRLKETVRGLVYCSCSIALCCIVLYPASRGDGAGRSRDAQHERQPRCRRATARCGRRTAPEGVGSAGGVTRLYLGCISAVSRLQLGCSSAAFLGCVSRLGRRGGAVSPHISPHLPPSRLAGAVGPCRVLPARHGRRAAPEPAARSSRDHSRDTAEIQPRYSRGTAEVQPRYSRGTAEIYSLSPRRHLGCISAISRPSLLPVEARVLTASLTRGYPPPEARLLPVEAHVRAAEEGRRGASRGDQQGGPVPARLEDAASPPRARASGGLSHPRHTPPTHLRHTSDTPPRPNRNLPRPFRDTSETPPTLCLSSSRACCRWATHSTLARRCRRTTLPGHVEDTSRDTSCTCLVGTPRGAAAGFTSEALGEVAEAKSADSTHRGVPLSPPQALGKLAETKSTVSDARPAQTSLLHYVAR